MDMSDSQVNELISELSDCKEDGHNCQNQALQTILIAGTVLGLLFGSTVISDGSRNGQVVYGSFNNGVLRVCL
jgi:hypothetical protein